jgi:hypothetical protein
VLCDAAHTELSAPSAASMLTLCTPLLTRLALLHFTGREVPGGLLGVRRVHHWRHYPAILMSCPLC